MPPKPRSLSVSKQCEECGGPNPVACKSCNACGADFYSSSLDKSDSPGDPSEVGSDAPSTPSSERRRSERVRREKPDYYDALEFETKRRADKYTDVGGVGDGPGPGGAGAMGTPKRPKRLATDKERLLYQSPRLPRSSQGEGHEGHEVQQRGRPRKHGRATLTWKKGQDDDDDERHPHDKRNRKRKHRDNKDSIGSIKEDSGNDPEEDFTGIFDDLPPEKSLQCQVSLAEINRKLGIVMCQPV